MWCHRSCHFDCIAIRWTISSASFAPNGTVPNGASGTIPLSSTLGRTLNAGSASKNVQLIREGLDYGRYDLNQLDLQASKRLRIGRYRVRGSFDLYNVFNSSWPYTVSSTFSTATTGQWQRPTNVLQQRFFKLSASIDF